MVGLNQLRLNGIIFTFFFLLLNTITLFSQGSELSKYLTHVAIFIPPAVLVLAVNKRVFYFIGFLFLALCSALFGSYANLSAAFFIIFAMKVEPQSELWLYVMVTVVVMVKTILRDYAISEAFGLVCGYAFIISTYKILHREPIIKKLDGKEGDIMTLLVSGKNTKTIAKELGITQNAINQHLKRLRLKYKIESTYQLIYYLTKSGLIGHNNDTANKEVCKSERNDKILKSDF